MLDGVSPTLYVARSRLPGGLFRSGIDAIAWEEVSLIPDADGSDFAMFDVTGTPFDPSVLYVSTSHGVFASTDEGANWEPVTDLVFHRLRPDLHEAGTLWGVHHYMGLHRITGLPVAGEPSPPGATALTLAPPYPNPASGTATLAFELPLVATISLSVYDVLGRRVAHPASGAFASGQHEVSLSTSGLAGGVYLVRLVATSEDGGTSVSTQRLTVTR
jgi:hypothetical protein